MPTENPGPDDEQIAKGIRDRERRITDDFFDQAEKGEGSGNPNELLKRIKNVNPPTNRSDN